jgi:CheY-like chemotaxis protein
MAELLLVEDEPDLCQVVVHLGQRGGHRVRCSADVASAWKSLQADRPDLVLLDVNLPGVSGLELCRRLCGADGDIPVALFTHPEVPGVLAAGLEAGARYLVSKDLVCRPDDWQRRLGEILASARGRGPAASLGCSAGVAVARPAVRWELLNRALSVNAVRSLGAEVLRIILSRALVRAFGRQAGGAPPWLSSDRCGFDLKRVPAAPPVEAVAVLVTALAEQVWCLLGTDASASFRDALTQAVPGVPGVP